MPDGEDGGDADESLAERYEGDRMGLLMILFGPVLIAVALYQFYVGGPWWILALAGVLLFLGLRDTITLIRYLRARN